MKTFGKRTLYTLLILVCITLQACSKPTTIDPVSTGAIAEMSSMQTIYILGDSLSAGYRLPIEQAYSTLLEQKLLALGYRVKVINGGESGDTSAGLKERLNWIVADARTGDIALVTIGANDGLQGLDTDKLKNNLKEIIISLQNRGIKTIIGGMLIPTNFGNKYRSDFAAVFSNVATETQSQIIPFILTGVAGNPALNLPDGIHPNKSGQVIVAETVTQFLIESNLLIK